MNKILSTLIVCLLVSNVALAQTATKKKNTSNTKKTTCTIKLGKFGTINIKL